MLVSYTSIGLLSILASIVQARFIEPSSQLVRPAKLQECSNSHSTFQNSLDGWVLERGSSDENYGFTSEGLEMKILPPAEHERLMDETVKPPLPYNKYEGKGFTFNATSYMRYGKFSASVKSAKIPGAVTAIILIADDGDEIDFEILAGGTDTITSNYFKSEHIEYGVNGQTIDPPAQPACDQFYEYSIEWTHEYIKWYIDGKEIRTLERNDAKYDLPSSAARVQIGLWDGSGASGTAQWARGPIDWNTQKEPVTAYIKDVKIECNPKYNQIV